MKDWEEEYFGVFKEREREGIKGVSPGTPTMGALPPGLSSQRFPEDLEGRAQILEQGSREMDNSIDLSQISLCPKSRGPAASLEGVKTEAPNSKYTSSCLDFFLQGITRMIITIIMPLLI